MHEMYQVYYRGKGVRYAERLFSPSGVKFTSLPRAALFHYVPNDNGTHEIDPKQPYFQGYQKKIDFDYVQEYVKIEGVVQKPAFALKEATRAFRNQNRQLWNWLPNAWVTNQNPEALVVLNYGYLDAIYKYSAVQLADYYRWLNRQRTIWTKAEEIAKVSDRNQFIICPIPTIIQGRTILDKFLDEPASNRLMTTFGQEGAAGYMLLDLYRWLSVSHRDKSLISILDPKHYSKINLVFIGKSGSDMVVNLGYLNSWIKGQPNTTDMPSLVQYEAIAIQKLFLKMCMTQNAVLFEEPVSETGEPIPEQPGTAIKTEEEPTSDTEAATPGSKSALKQDDETTDLVTVELETELSDEEESDVNPSGVAAGVTLSIKPNNPATMEPSERKEPSPVGLSAELFLDLEKDMAALDRLSLVHLKNSGVNLNAVDEEVPAEQPPIFEEVKEKAFSKKRPEEILKKWIDEDAEANLITAAEYRKLNETVSAYRESKDPYGSDLPRIEAMVIKPEDTAITKESTAIVVGDEVPDKTMASSSLIDYDKRYQRHVYKKDILNAIDAVQAAGVTIRRHEIDVRHSALGSYEHHSLEIKPIDGSPSNISFTFPKVDEDGTFLAGGNKYLLRKQRVDLPIRKIAPRIVALSTYYGKTFVQSNSKVVNDDLAWLYRKINAASFETDNFIKEVSLGNVFDNDFVAPYIYNALGNEFERIVTAEYTLVFDPKKRLDIAPEALKAIEKNGRVYCGHKNVRHPNQIVVDKQNQFFLLESGQEVPLGEITDLLRFDTEKQPINFAEVRVFSKYIPVGVVLGYYLGLDGLITLLREPYRIVEGRKQKNLEKDEYAITFKDVSLIFKTTNVVSTMILSGFNDFEKVIKLYDRKMFNHKDVYLNLLMTKKMAAVYIRELDMMENAFVDPISREILEEMHEPQTFIGLMVRGTELLTTYHHPASQDRRAMRERGYERFSGVLYKELMQAVRQFRNKNLVGRSKVDMSPYQVWNAIMKDSSLKIVEDINPVQNLKEAEVITYAGSGGRDKDSMNKASRAYHKSDFGILSESTVDSSAVGTIAYLSANPNIKNVRGMASDERALNPTSIMSTSAQISPAAMNDNPKRIMFISTQHSHTIASEAYRQPYVRTGYEFVVGQRTGKMFCTAASEDGKVTGLVDKGIIVTYASGEQVGVELGRVYGKAEGTVYPHDIISPFSVGDKFKKGDILAYNTKFFEPDFLEPKKVIMKVSGTSRVAFLETNGTHEDSSTISEKLGTKFKTEVAKIKSYVINFNQNLLEVRKIGEVVGPKDVLMIIEDEITASHGQFSDDSLSTLKRLSNVAPRAGVLATVEKIEVFYNGDKRDMSPTLKRIADKSDNDMAAAAKASARPVVNGRVTEEYRVSGTPLELDKAEVRIYLSVKAGTGVGDKAVFGHQMKSTVAEVHEGLIHSEDGEEIDAVFSYRSVAGRDALSPAILGTTITLLDAIGKKASKLFFGET